MSDASSTFSLREFLQLVVPPLIALTLFTPWFSSLQERVTIEGILFAAVVLGLLLSGPAGAVSTWLFTKLLPIYRRRRREVDATGQFMRKSLDFARLETHLTKDDRELADILASLSICYRQTAMYLVVYLFSNIVRLGAAIASSRDQMLASLTLLSKSPDVRTVTAVWNEIAEPATPMLGGWSLPTIVAVVTSHIAILFLVKESLDTKQALFGVQGLYNGYALKAQKDDAEVARAVWGQVLLNGIPGANVDVVLKTLGSKPGDSGRPERSVRTEEHGLFSFPLEFDAAAADMNYEVCVDRQMETITVQHGKISGVLVSLTPPDTRADEAPWYGRLLFAHGFRRMQAKLMSRLNAQRARPDSPKPATPPMTPGERDPKAVRAGRR